MNNIDFYRITNLELAISSFIDCKHFNQKEFEESKERAREQENRSLSFSVFAHSYSKGESHLY